MPVFHVAVDPKLEGVRRISAHADFPRPHVGIVAALHGDEVCGLSVHQALLQQAEAGTLPFGEGTLVLIHGNIEATRQGVRYTPDGYDLNRICNLRFRDQLVASRWGYEHHRAIELVPLLDDLDAALDLHSATAPTVPFAVALPGALEIAKKVGVRWVTHGWDDASDIADGVALARIASRGKPAVAVECGQHQDSRAAMVGMAVLARFLDAIGLWDETVESAEPARVLQIFAALPKPSEQFRFVRPLRGFEAVREGQLLGRDDVFEMHCPGDGFAVLPNDGVPLRKNVVYVAREQD